MSEPELDKVSLVLHTSGNEFSFWTAITISDDFLSPCQTVDLEIAADETRFDLTKAIRCGDAFTVLVNDAPQCTGFIDRVGISYSGHGGTRVTVKGRDGLSRLVDSHVDPRMQVSEKSSLLDIATELIQKQFALEYTVFETNDPSRNAALGKPVKTTPKPKRHKPKDKIKDVRPHDNEGAFSYFTRLSHRQGLHLWMTPDAKGVVISDPEYNQEPAYELNNYLDGRAANNILGADSAIDVTHVPSHVWVRGKDSKPGPKAKLLGFYDNSANTSIFKPFYFKDSESSTKEHCDTVAAYMVGKAMRDFVTYECNVRGFSSSTTARVWNVDTVVNLHDEKAGVEGLMWIESRTFRKSRDGGTTTHLKLLPAQAMIMDYLLSDSPPSPPSNYGAAAGKIKKPNARLAPFEERVASRWFNTLGPGDGVK